MRIGILRLWIVVAFLALAALPPAAQAQSEPSSSGANVDSKALSAARELIAVTKATAMVEQMLPAVSASMGQAIVAVNPEQGQRIMRLMDEIMMPEIKARAKELEDGFAAIYVSHFTAAELTELVVFYRSPIGAKLVGKMPAVAQDGMKLGQAWGEKVSREVLEKIAPQLRDQGLKSPI